MRAPAYQALVPSAGWRPRGCELALVLEAKGV